MLVHAAELSQIRQFVRAGHVADGREDRVLNHGTKQDARAEAGRLLGGALHQALRRVLLVSDRKPAVLLADRAPASVQVKQRHAVVVRRVDLRVIPARGQVRSGERGELDGLSRPQ